MSTAKIIYTKTDEAPALATYSFLPIVKAFTSAAGISVETRDISLAARILASFPELLTAEQRQPDALAELGELAKTPDANIIKLPNISASIPQLVAAIAELQSQGYAVPDYPEEPEDAAGKAIQKRYAKVLGSAVNPGAARGQFGSACRAGGEEFRQDAPAFDGCLEPGLEVACGAYAGRRFLLQRAIGHCRRCRRSAHRTPGGGRQRSRFCASAYRCSKGEVVDGSRMSVAALREFFAREMAAARKEGVLLSLHLKATMMKVSDPIMFGHAVTVFLRGRVRETCAAVRRASASSRTTASATSTRRSPTCPPHKRATIEADIAAVYEKRPALAMVDSDKGITNLHVPSDVIIDASMPAAIRSSGKMWGPDGKLHDMKAMIPDRCYAGIYQEVIDFCRKQRRVRRDHDGQCLQCRADGAEGRGIRFARQDLRDSTRPARCA